ncbi:hypothetical protein KR018_004749, partial [Drosophila ironensis]
MALTSIELGPHPQAMLSDALANKLISEFMSALDAGAKADLLDENHQSVFEKALSTPKCGDFIDACIRKGCDVNYVRGICKTLGKSLVRSFLQINPKLNKAAINYAVESLDLGNLVELLRQRSGVNKVQVDWQYCRCTPLLFLSKSVTEENSLTVKNCLERLLDYGASPNVVDANGLTPLQHILGNKSLKKETAQKLVLAFLANPQLQIQDELLQSRFPELLMLYTLMRWNEQKFKEKLQEYLSNVPDKSKISLPVSLLNESIKRGLLGAVRSILEIPEFTSEPSDKCPLQLALDSGKSMVLGLLLMHPQFGHAIKIVHLNRLASTTWNQSAFGSCNYKRCFEILLDSNRLDINQTDACGLTPLLYATKYHNTEAIKELLKRGAYIGSENCTGALYMQNMPPEVLQEHFDSCITSNEEDTDEPTYAILMDFKNLLLQKPMVQNEVAPLCLLAETMELRHLLKHPLILAFLSFKWNRLLPFLILSILNCMLFSVSIILHILLRFHQQEHTIWTWLSWLGVAYLTTREGFQLFTLRLQYFKSSRNILVLMLITSSALTCLEMPAEWWDVQNFLAAITILMVTVQVAHMLGSLRVLSISTHVLMLQAVCIRFVKIFALYSIFLMAFSLCFYITFDQPSSVTFIKSIQCFTNAVVMMTGELDASHINFKNLYAYIIFILFVLFIVIVLVNVLSGVAIGDTQDIRAQAELIDIISRTQWLKSYEMKCSLMPPFIRRLFQKRMNLYPNYMAQSQISVMPKYGNMVFFHKTTP